MHCHLFHALTSLGLFFNTAYITAADAQHLCDFTLCHFVAVLQFVGMSVREISQAAQEYCDTFPDE